MQKVMRYSAVGLMAVMLALAGPVALGLAVLAGGPTSEVVRISDQMAPISNLLLVQDDSEAAPPAATDAPNAVSVTPTQEVVVEWGNWVSVILKPFQDLALALIPVIALYISSFIPTWAKLFFPATKVNELVENAVKQAIAGVKGATDGGTLTKTVTNDVLRQAVVYMLAQAPGLVKILGDNLPQLIQKALARLPAFAKVPKDYTIEEAIKAVSLASVKKSAASQGVSKEVGKAVDNGGFRPAGV